VSDLLGSVLKGQFPSKLENAGNSISHFFEVKKQAPIALISCHIQSILPSAIAC